jgi:hypothetical protein
MRSERRAKGGNWLKNDDAYLRDTFVSGLMLGNKACITQIPAPCNKCKANLQHLRGDMFRT